MTRGGEETARPATAGEGGASLVVALVFLVFFSVVSAALLGQGFTSETAATAQQQAQNRDAAGDGAIEVAINRLSGAFNTSPANIVSDLGRDPNDFTNPPDPPCVFNVQSTLKNPATGGFFKVTTTSAADVGSNSGELPTGDLPTDTPLQPRIMTISACLRNVAVVDTDTAACGSTSGDQMLVTAQVRFDVTIDVSGDESGSAGSAQANLPEVLSWDHVLLDQTP